jgi:hydroxyethylthiazole kinase-like sugar kinase family protein
MEQARIVTSIGILKKFCQSLINAIAINQSAESSIILNAANFANTQKRRKMMRSMIRWTAKLSWR